MRICLCTVSDSSYSHSHTLTITCTCCYDEIKGTQDLKIYSHAHSLILSLTLTAWSSDTLFSLRKLVQAPTWAQAASTAVFGQQGHYSKGRGQGSLKWQVILSLALLATLIAASCSAGVETRRTGTAPFDVHLNPNSGLIALSLALLLCSDRVLTLTVLSRVCYKSYTVLAPKVLIFVTLSNFLIVLSILCPPSHHATCLWDCNVSLIVCCHSNSAGVASFYPAVDDNPDTKVNNLAECISSMVNSMKLLDVSKFRTQPKARLRAAEQVCTAQTAALPC